MPERRVHFYRVFNGRNEDTLEPLAFDAAAAFDEVDQLDFFDAENGRYIDAGDGDLAFCLVDRLPAPQRIRIARSRRRHLPPLEHAGNLDDLEIPEDAGLAEQTYLVFFDDNVVGCIYNSFSPRVSTLRRYVRARCSEEYKDVDFAPLIRQDVGQQLEDLDQVRVFEFRVLRSYQDRLGEASRSLARSVRQLNELGQSQQVSIILQPEPYQREWLNPGILADIKRIFGLDDLEEGVTRFRVKGRNGETGRLDEIDVLKEKFVVHRDVRWADDRSAALYAPSAYAAIEAAHDQLHDHLVEAAAAI